MAESAGDRVSELMALSTVDTATVTANWRKNWPVSPGRKALGTNTAASTRDTPTTAAATSFMAVSVASTGVLPAAMWNSTASTTTMASSTTMPMASTMPNSVSELMLYPRAYMAANVPTSETTTDSIGMTAARQLCRNTSTTNATSTMASTRVSTTASTDASMNVVGSKMMAYSMPAGQPGDSRSCLIFSRTVSAVVKALAPGSWKMGRPMDGRPSSVAAVS
jgi:hypothetical protein